MVNDVVRPYLYGSLDISISPITYGNPSRGGLSGFYSIACNYFDDILTIFQLSCISLKTSIVTLTHSDIMPILWEACWTERERI